MKLDHAVAKVGREYIGNSVNSLAGNFIGEAASGRYVVFHDIFAQSEDIIHFKVGPALRDHYVDNVLEF